MDTCGFRAAFREKLTPVPTKRTQYEKKGKYNKEGVCIQKI
jgi:hypothetical protein